ncbi:MAG TPA: invasion associated locus B family protein [Rhizomicrobium sp.]|nr:invasion associated locus B family protein [Rhizomicrobium sp.]
MTNSTTVLTAIGTFILGALVAFGADRYVFKTTDQRDKMETIAAFQGWRLTCPPRTVKSANCIMQQALARKGTGTILAELNIAPDKNKTDVMTVIAPLGVFVLPGVKVSAGNSGEKIVPYKTCVQMGCVATLPIDAGLAAAMSRSRNIQVTVAADGKAVPINFSLNGYRDALAARAVDMAARSKQ